jgi:hypothetical protein
MRKLTSNITLSIIGLLLLVVLISNLLISTPSVAQSIQTHTPLPASVNRVEIYQKYETTFNVTGEFINPYDPAQVEVLVNFTSPEGRSVIVPAFFMQEYNDICRADCSVEELETSGSGRWRVRFTPDEVGTWQFTAVARIGSTESMLRTGRFDVSESSHPGFIQVAPNGRYFEFDDGTPYFPIGQNLGWSWDEGGSIYAYLEWLDRLQAAGANYARINIDVPWFIGLEWTPPVGQYGDLGQQAAWRFDTILDEAERRGIYLQVVLIWHQTFREYTGGSSVSIPRTPIRPDVSGDFDNSPYNARLSGSLQGPGDIFFNTAGQQLLQQRLRYIMARWGYSPNIFAWEIVDELDRMAAFSAERDTDWVTQMAETIQEYDPNDHLITVGMKEFNDIIEANPLLDFTQSEVYQSRPIEHEDQVTSTLFTLFTSLYGVSHPVLLTEFSLNPWFEPAQDDPTGIHIRNTIWTAALSGTAGSAMPWWWDTYIDPNDLYSIYTPLVLYSQGIPWNKLNLQPVQPGLVANSTIDYEPLRIDGFNRQSRSISPPDTIYRITADGASPPISLMSSYLYGREFNAENSRPQTMIISPPIDTTMIVNIQNVSFAADAQLTITVDGVTVINLNLAAGTEQTSLTIPLTAGQHTVVFDNLGEDWLQIRYVEIADYRAPLRVVALADREEGIVLAWIHNRAYTWDQAQTNEPLEPLDFTLELSDMLAGVYRVEFWDTETGNVVGEERITLSSDSDRMLRIPLLPIRKQLALRIFRMAAPEDEQPQATFEPTRTPPITSTAVPTTTLSPTLTGTAVSNNGSSSGESPPTSSQPSSGATNVLPDPNANENFSPD